MSEYNDVVHRQKVILEAEIWAKGVATIHAHSLTSMYYETRPDRTGDELMVLDIEFNDGVIEREYLRTGKKETIGTHLTGQELYEAFSRKK